MSLALHFYFWEESDWTGAPAPPPPPASPAVDSPTDAGGGGKRNRKPLYRDNRRQADEDFWDVREQYLKSLLEETAPIPEPIVVTEEPPPAIPPAPRPVNPLVRNLYAERAARISALRLATDVQSLKAQGARLIEINRAITQSQLRQARIEVAAAEKARKKQEEDARMQAAEVAMREQRRRERIKTLQKAGTTLLSTLRNLRK